MNVVFREQRVRIAALLASAVAAMGCGHRALRTGKDAGVPEGGLTDVAQDVTVALDSSSAPGAFPDAPGASVADAGLPDACQPVGCSRNGTDHCGEICDGCGGHVTCPTACGPERQCDLGRGICVDSVCTPLSCLRGDGTRYCGTIGDGCGGALNCGDCPEGQRCEDHICSRSPTCRRLTCTPAAPYQTEPYCEVIDDCCGGTLDCGPCRRIGWRCQNHVCDGSGLANCVGLRCQGDGYAYCGTIGDACGARLDCPAECPLGWTCRNHLCVGLPGLCLPIACEAAGRHRFCGTIGDGCGGSLACGNCPAGEVCAGTGNCLPSTCDGGCAPADPRPPSAPLPAPLPPARYQCPAPTPVIEAPTLPPVCP